MVIFMKENGKMIKHMEKVDIYIEMAHHTKVIGLKINNMVWELKDGQIVLNMRVSIIWE